ncbi:MAG: extracellular solute-binding protein [Clostridiales bacterium]|nr:extracellular solute-binding protein [Clostridiales bacterium]
MRKFAALLLIICLLPLAALGTANDAPQAVVMAGYEEKDTFRSWGDNLFFRRMEQRTGVTFVYQQTDGWQAWQQAKTAMLAPGAALPEVLFKAGLAPAETMDMLAQGVLIDLKPLLADNAPHLSRLLDEHADILAAITLPDGRIGALPYINLAPTQNALWINMAWLTALRLEMPATAEELQSVLQAFKDKDPNQNARADEIPLSFIGPYDLKYLGHAWGLTANDFNVFARDGQAGFMPLEAGFRPFIAWLRALYDQGLLDPNGFIHADALRRVTDAKATNRYGAFLAPLPSSLVPPEWVGDYAVVPPLAHEGAQVYRRVAPRATPGAFAITSACKDPAAMLRWVDYLYSPEGAILATAGEEGIDYLVDGDGTWRKTDSAQQNSFLAETSIMTGAVPPGVSNDAFQRRYAEKMVRDLSEQIDRVSAVSKDPFPPFSLTAAQEAEIAPLQGVIGRYVDESIARWVTGEWAVTDEQFAAFEAELETLGLQSFMAFWQRVLDAMPEGAI